MAPPRLLRSVAAMNGHESSQSPFASAPFASAPPFAGGLNRPPRTGEPAITVSDLSMRYGDRMAVTGLTFQVYLGELLAILGPNGAGKTTTVEILEGFRRRSAGTVSVLGVDPWRAGRHWRARIGVMLQETGPERELTVTECLRLYGGYYADPWPPTELLHLTGLQAEANQSAASLSGGQRRRLDLAIALVGRPGLLFLDEPTTGFDPAARHEAWATIAALKGMGTTIILTSHYMDEVERLADRIGIMRTGAMVLLGASNELTGHGGSRVGFTLPAGVNVHDLPHLIRAKVSTVENGTVQMISDSPTNLVASIMDWARQNGHELSDIEVRRPSLEDLYLQVTAAEGTS
jgi:ABC-2 type transport system ATP-binding protein